MNSFRNPKYLERKEDVVFDREQPLATNPGNSETQTRNNIRFLRITQERLLHLIGITRDFQCILKLTC